jgi:choline-sulfatase
MVVNVIFILSDQHNPAFSGCYGGLTRTPHLDALAASGARFANMYSNCPLCVPSRASLITSRYPHEIMSWDNTSPYDGKLPGWGHYFREHAIRHTTIGKLDLAKDADLGIEDMRMAKLRASFDITALYREEAFAPRGSFNFVAFTSEGGVKTNEEGKEAEITEAAIRWLTEDRPLDQPWVLNINYHRPHPKWHPQPDRFNYYNSRIDRLEDRFRIPFDELNELDQAQSVFTCGYETDERQIRLAQAAYHAVIEELDESIGEVLKAVDELGIRDEVLIVYASDHGELARAHGAWGKVSLHEDSVRVPLILSGPGVPANTVIEHPVSLIDVYPTINEALGLPAALFSRGRSLLRLAQTGSDPDHIDYVFAESHAGGMLAGSFMLRRGDWKLLEYVGYRSVLYNLREDPQELHDLLADETPDPIALDKLRELRQILNTVCSPEGVDRLARQQQLELRDELAATGQLYVEQVKRGYEPNREHLIPLGQGQIKLGKLGQL